MSSHRQLRGNTMRNLKHIQRQIRLMDLRLQLLREKLCVARMQKLAFPCCCPFQTCSRPMGKKCLMARQEPERQLDRLKRFSRMLTSCCSDNCLALIDVKGFDPRDISVTVRDGKVTVSAEHKEEHNTCMAKTRNYRKFTKKFCLPPGVCENEVTYSVDCNNFMKIEAVPKCCPCLCDY